MKIFFSYYELKPKNKSQAPFQKNKGVLIKFLDQEGAGYSLYHPIKKLGDLEIKKVLSLLKEESFKSKVIPFPEMNCLRSGPKDSMYNTAKGRAVATKDTYFSGIGITQNIYNRRLTKERYLEGEVLSYKSHLSITDAVTDKDPGFGVYKIKIRSLSEIESDLEKLKNLDKKFIFDFNGQEKVQNFKNMEKGLKDFFKGYVVYSEDPASEVNQNITTTPVAKDFVDYKKYDFEIIKPSSMNMDLPHSREGQIVTSYLDHPVGQILAAQVALRYNIKRDCGISTHLLYEDTNFHSLLSNNKNFILPSWEKLESALEQEPFKEL